LHCIITPAVRPKPGFCLTQRTQCKAVAYVFDASDAGDERKVSKQVRNKHSLRKQRVQSCVALRVLR